MEEHEQSISHWALLQALQAAQLRFLAREEASEVFRELLASLVRLSGSERGFIGEVRDGQLIPIAIAEPGRGVTASRGPLEDEPDLADLDDLVATLLEGRTIVRAPRPPHSDAVWGIPLFRGDTLVGAAGLVGRGAGYSEVTRESLAPFVDSCSVMVDALRADRERGEAELRAEQALVTRSRFLATVSHELRTPLHAILGLTDLLVEGAAEPEQRSLGERVLANAELLLAHIEDLLDVSRIDAEGVALEEAPFDPRDVIEQVCDGLALRAAEKHLTLVCDLDPDLPPVTGDARRVRQVLTNLVGNAVKFTEVGSIEVRAGAPDGALLVEVADTGPGISEADRARIFEPFSRGDSGSGVEGTGLGLAISAALARAMGGELTVESVVGDGSVFRARLPLTLGPRTARRARLEGVQLAVLHPHRAARRAIVRLLEAEGASVRQLEVADPDVAAAVVVAADDVASAFVDSGRRMLLVRATARPPGGPLARYPAIGAPVLREPLVAAVEAAIGREPAKGSRMGLPRVGGGGRAPRLHVLVVEDNEDSRGLVRRLLERDGHRVDVAEDGEVGFQRAREHRYDVVMTDLQMPRVDGLTFVRRLRAMEAQQGGPRVPVLALSAHALEAYRRAAFEAGMDDFLTKPVRLQLLRDRIRRWVDPRPLVLCADDSEDVRRLVAAQLGGRYRVALAADASDCEAVFERQRVSVALIDLELGLDDGRELADRLHEAAPEVPLVAFTGHTDVPARPPFSAVLVKPVRQGALRAAVAEVLSGVTSGVSGPPVADIDPDIADLLPPFYRNRLTDLRRMHEALARGDLEEVRRVAHGLKGCGAAFGFPPITAHGEVIESAARRGDANAAVTDLEALGRYLAEVRVSHEGETLLLSTWVERQATLG